MKERIGTQNIDIITEIRGFDRFYTDLPRLSDPHILDSGYSLSEARILFEISKMELCTENQPENFIMMPISISPKTIE